MIVTNIPMRRQEILKKGCYYIATVLDSIIKSFIQTLFLPLGVGNLNFFITQHQIFHSLICGFAIK